MEVLLLLAERRGQLVTREEIIEKLWGKDVFLDTDNSINGAIRKIRQVLKDDPQQPRYVETLPGRGYRFIAPVFDGELRAPAPPPTKTEPGPALVQSNAIGTRNSVDETPVAAPHRRRVTSLFALAAVCVVGVLTWAAWHYFDGERSGSHIRSIAVLPLQNLSGDPTQDFFADGMTEELITELSRIHSLRVISHTSVMEYKGTRKHLPQIAR